MNSVDILNECHRSGVTLSVDVQGGLSCRGDRAAVSRLLPKIREHKPDLLRVLTRRAPPEPPSVDLEALARAIAEKNGLTAAKCLSILDDDDREAIRTGSDPGRANAWRAAVASLVYRGEWQALPGYEAAKLVTCETCSNSRAVGPELVDCAALVLSPAAVGPYRRWAADVHLCEKWREDL